MLGSELTFARFSGLTYSASALISDNAARRSFRRGNHRAIQEAVQPGDDTGGKEVLSVADSFETNREGRNRLRTSLPHRYLACLLGCSLANLLSHLRDFTSDFFGQLAEDRGCTHDGF